MAAEVRNTKQKQAVYEVLLSLDHPTATEVFDRVHETYPSISRGTVFRVLGAFARDGKIRKLQLSDSDDRYDPRMTAHYHARCRGCGRVYDQFLPDVDQLLSGLSLKGFACDGYELEFFGSCENCKKGDE